MHFHSYTSRLDPPWKNFLDPRLIIHINRLYYTVHIHTVEQNPSTVNFTNVILEENVRDLEMIKTTGVILESIHLCEHVQVSHTTSNTLR